MDEKKEKKKDFSCYTFAEVRTATGQLIEVACRSEDVEEIKKFMSENIKDIDIPTTGRVNVPHGGYGRYTRYDITQHEYAGGGPPCGYVEILEIKNPPDGRCGNVIHKYFSRYGSTFYEFNSIENAKVSWRLCLSNDDEKITKQKGFIRRVKCGGLDPWFYAVADQHLTGDFVFPDIICEDDPIFRVFKKFIVRDSDGLASIKTCMGSMHYERDKYPYSSGEKYQCTRVYWDDGTTWDSYSSTDKPQPLDEETMWIQEAVDKFRELLSGKTNRFEIEFVNGDKFIGRFSPKDKKRHHKEGFYKVSVVARKKGTKGKGKKSELKFEFKPTPEVPTIEGFLNNLAEEQGAEILSVESVIRIWEGKGYIKKWAGVYSAPKRD